MKGLQVCQAVAVFVLVPNQSYSAAVLLPIRLPLMNGRWPCWTVIGCFSGYHDALAAAAVEPPHDFKGTGSGFAGTLTV